MLSERLGGNIKIVFFLSSANGFTKFQGNTNTEEIETFPLVQLWATFLNWTHFALYCFWLSDNIKNTVLTFIYLFIYQEQLVTLHSQVSVHFLPRWYTINERPMCFGLLEAGAQIRPRLQRHYLQRRAGERRGYTRKRAAAVTTHCWSQGWRPEYVCLSGGLNFLSADGCAISSAIWFRFETMLGVTTARSINNSVVTCACRIELVF